MNVVTEVMCTQLKKDRVFWQHAAYSHHHVNPKYKTPCKSMFPSESLDLQSWSWLIVCQGAWEHTFRNMFPSICQDVAFTLVTNKPKQCPGLPPQ